MAHLKFFGISASPQQLTDTKFLSMARMYWGKNPMPEGAEIIGGYSDPHKAGALIRLTSGRLVCGKAGIMSSIEQ